MIERAFHGGKRYWGLVAALVALVLPGCWFYADQLREGLGITGMSRDVSWGLYIAQFVFTVGVAASAVMVILPYYLHDYKAFGRITILGEFLAVPAVVASILFVIVDMGRPDRALNLILHPSPRSMMFWDLVALVGYLVMSAVVGFKSFDAERAGSRPPRWIGWLVIVSIPWAFSIHTVTALLFSGLGARPFWLTAIMAPRFLASAFASGPAILVLLALLLRKAARFDVGREPVAKLAEIAAYAMAASIFFAGLEIFTIAYSGIPAHVEHLRYLYLGLDGATAVAPWMWASAALSVASLVMLLVPRVRRSDPALAVACAAVVAGVWIEKGMGTIAGGFVPSPLGRVTEYRPTLPEIAIAIGVYAASAVLLVALYGIVVSVRAARRDVL